MPTNYTEARYQPGGKSNRDNRTSVNIDPSTGQESASDRLVDQLIKEGRLSREQALQVVDQVFGSQMGNLQDAKQKADWYTQLGLSQYGDFLNSDEMAAIDPAAYVGDVESQGAKAYADQRSRDAQYSALSKLQGWTNTQLTPEERFLYEQQKQAEQQSLRAAREATLRDLGARGVRSGAAEMAGLLGGAQVASQNRLLGDLGAQANASRRALLATQAYGDLAGDISAQTFDERYKTGTAADEVAEFNNRLRTDYDVQKQRFQLEQQDSRAGRKRDLYDRQRDAQNDAFDRQRGIANYAALGSGQKVEALTGNQVTDALKIALGQEEAAKAQKLLNKKDEGWIPDSVPLFGGF